MVLQELGDKLTTALRKLQATTVCMCVYVCLCVCTLLCYFHPPPLITPSSSNRSLLYIHTHTHNTHTHTQVVNDEVVDGMLQEICRALVEADVNIKVVSTLRKAIKDKVIYVL